MKFKKNHTTVTVEKYREGLEDYFKYHIPMFGLFTKEECIDAGFTPDFEKDKIPCILTSNGELCIKKSDYIVTEEYGARHLCSEHELELYYTKL